jgi:hypothetical protein
MKSIFAAADIIDAGFLASTTSANAACGTVTITEMK